ncbi:MAG: PTS sugar transporter subunit IIA [Clostridiales bacterium]|nr:PTS sugar transporter subunit IIA [Clostridiales bacterium]
MEQIFSKELIWLDEEYETQTQFFETMGERLYEKGLVKKEFSQGLIKREAVFPTGLKTETHQIAIPHTDAIYVEKTSISFVRLKKPIRFLHIGMPEVEVDAEMAFVLGIKNVEGQVEVLATLARLIQNYEGMERLKQMDSQEEIAAYLNDFFAKDMKNQ